MIAVGLPVYVFGLVEAAVIDKDVRSVTTLLVGTAIVLLGLVGTDWVQRHRVARTRVIGWREVWLWLFFGVFLAVVGIPIALWIRVAGGQGPDFPLTLAQELDLPSAAIAGGALGQYFIRRGLNPENSWDRRLLIVTCLVLGFAILVSTVPPSPSFLLAIPTHIIIFLAAVIVGAFCTYRTVA